jgi:GntR family transcriptional regulator, transcriptional repressor for pyruvate dehydrogenase complex
MADHLSLQPPRRVTVVESIIEQIVALIQKGTLKPGDRLPSERQLMEMLSVSRSSVREALQGLAAMDLVEGRVGEGTFIKAFKPRFPLGLDIAALSTALQKEMRLHLNQARLIVEEDIVMLAAANKDGPNRDAIMSALQKYEALQPAVSDDEGWPAHDQIHLAIAQATGNPILVRMIQMLLDLVPRALRDKGLMRGEPPEATARIEAERQIHRQLCEAIAAGDGPAAKEWIRRHARHEEQIVSEYYGTLEGTPADAA